MARPKQFPPDHPRHHLPDKQGYHCGFTDKKTGLAYKCNGQDDWKIWLNCSGRGVGKTLLGSNWIIENALKYPESTWAVVEPAYRQIDGVAFSGKTGILKQLLPGELDNYNKNNCEITLRNGSKIYGYSADKSAASIMRGFAFWGAWLDEVRDYDDLSVWEEVIHPALREGAEAGWSPKVVATTTPGFSPLLKTWRKQYIDELGKRGESGIHFTPANTLENIDAYSADYIEYVREALRTEAGRQEFGGEFLDEFQGSLWSRDIIDRNRIPHGEFFLDDGFDFARFRRILVAWDPSMTQGRKSDEHGIVVAGEGVDGHGYLIEDLSLHGSNEQAAATVVRAFHEYRGDCVVTEANQAGDWLVGGIRAVDPGVPVRKVHAMKGKFARAQPIGMLAELDKLHYIGEFSDLEDQLCALTPDSDRNKRHDDRADAFVWAMTALLPDLTSGSFLAAYNMCYCQSCGHAFRKIYSKCPSCGKEIDPEGTIAQSRPGSWAHAYMNQCGKCGSWYTKKENECPKCTPNPGEYMAQVMKISGQGQGWLNYTEKNWFRRR